ncbi:MAG: hypothetical protein JSU74_07985 [Candidatus Zixiibacteriota bacterium]|nr:MAG: hypothetical protein JSU74_07985 [candidate division Zixibacteria bacterium]
MGHNQVTEDLFLDRVNIELKRAERYRIFVSVIVLDVGFVQSSFPNQTSSVMTELRSVIQKNVRAIDNVSLLTPSKLGLLFPETTRQGAEIASRRISDLVRTRLSELSNQDYEQVIPLEMASYPDAAGAKSITDFLREYSEKNIN